MSKQYVCNSFGLRRLHVMDQCYKPIFSQFNCPKITARFDASFESENDANFHHQEEDVQR